MQLVLANAQSSLTSLERGKHALTATTRRGKNGGLSLPKYADILKRPENSVRNEVWAYEVYREVSENPPTLGD
jgi:hypothetical protein